MTRATDIQCGVDRTSDSIDVAVRVARNSACVPSASAAHT